MKISACMITKNEEKNIVKCIESFKEIVEEIIVVDTGSTDRTVQIAKELGARVYEYPWHQDFSAAKNFALNKVSGNWIIFLDADEYFEDGKAKNIPSIIKNLPPNHNAIACKMFNVDLSNGKVLDQITHVRIFKNDPFIRYVNPIHEMLVNKKEGEKLQAYLVGEEELAIIHTGYSSDNLREKAERNLTFLLNELPYAKNKPAVYQYLSDCYFGLKDYENAITYAKKFIESGAKFVGYNVKPYQNIISSMISLRKNKDEIKKEIIAGMNQFPHHPLFHLYMANLLFDEKKYDAAYGEYELTLSLQKEYKDVEINQTMSSLYLVYYYMGVISEYRNDLKVAISSYIKSLSLEKYNENALKRLCTLIQEFPTDEILLLFKRLYNDQSVDEINFLIYHLREIPGLKKIFSYYILERFKRSKVEDHWLLYLFLNNGHHEKVFRLSTEVLLEDPKNTTYQMLLFLSAVQGSIDLYESKYYQLLPATTQKIIKLLRENHLEIQLTKDDKEQYLQILENLIYHGDYQYKFQIVNIRKHFEINIDLDIASLLINKREYQLAIQVLNDYLNTEDGKQYPRQILFHIGLCHYKLEQYDQAKSYFSQLKSADDNDDELDFYLKWTDKHLAMKY